MGGGGCVGWLRGGRPLTASGVAPTRTVSPSKINLHPSREMPNLAQTKFITWAKGFVRLHVTKISVPSWPLTFRLMVSPAGEAFVFCSLGGGCEAARTLPRFCAPRPQFPPGGGPKA